MSELTDTELVQMDAEDEAKRNRELLISLLDDDGYLPNGSRLDGEPPSFKMVMAWAARNRPVNGWQHDVASVYSSDVCSVTHDLVYSSGLHHRLPLRIIADDPRLPASALYVVPIACSNDEFVAQIKKKLTPSKARRKKATR